MLLPITPYLTSFCDKLGQMLSLTWCQNMCGKNDYNFFAVRLICGKVHLHCFREGKYGTIVEWMFACYIIQGNYAQCWLEM